MKKNRQRKNVTWSPVVVPVNKPSRIKSQHRQVEKSHVRMINSTTGLDHYVSGYMTAKARANTRSLLLTMRNSTHRDVQFLIDLPNQRIRRIYDGRHSWDVHDDGSPFCVQCDLGQIDWKDDEIRDANARGFRLDWLNGETRVSARRCQDKHRAYRNSQHSRRHSTHRRHARSTRRKGTQQRGIEFQPGRRYRSRSKKKAATRRR